MKVRGKVRLLCEFCKKAVVRLNRDQHYVYIYCTKNARHKQRSKFLSMSTQAEHDHAPAGPISLPCLPEPTYARVQQHMLNNVARGLLGNRHTSVLGELYWRSATQGQGQ
ncbi:hypothetical protein Agub_g9459 [Astrephomene gubernaculifera]|uniref:Ribosomal protein n=1 Tax=Astrephomene gubernaculifera TaxID=47775 RepID=A0AAD3HP38_9CHLO|nr:hypothetical protein Agub_g9459 [Astrephomene gubernaculifera]